MQHGRKTHMNRQQKRQFAGRSQQGPSSALRPDLLVLTTREETMRRRWTLFLHTTVISWRCRWRLWWRRARCGNRRLASGTRRILWGRARLYGRFTRMRWSRYAMSEVLVLCLAIGYELRINL